MIQELHGSGLGFSGAGSGWVTDISGVRGFGEGWRELKGRVEGCEDEKSGKGGWWH